MSGPVANDKRETAVPHPQTYTIDDVLRQGFEARCSDASGTRYLWHGPCGLRVDARCGATTMVRDPLKVPEGPWTATAWGQQELRQT
jgi:hypothetical protein